MRSAPGKRSERSTSSSEKPAKDSLLFGQVHDFSDELGHLLKNVLPEAPTMDVTAHEARYRITPQGRSVPLFIKKKELAALHISFLCQPDVEGRYLSVARSSFSLKAKLDGNPVFRFEYAHDLESAPQAHLHVHAHRGALSHLLSQAEHKAPHDMASLHLPVGGSRLRPCLEDLLQFLIDECGFDAKRGWRRHVDEGRERWRRRQASALVRAVPSEAVRVLTDLGYQVTPPDEEPSDSEKALKTW